MRLFFVLMILLVVFFVSVNVYADESPEEKIKEFFTEKLQEELQKKDYHVEWDGKIEVNRQGVILLIFTHKFADKQIFVKIGNLDKDNELRFKNPTQILLEINDKIRTWGLLGLIEKAVQDYNTRHETNIAVRTIAIKGGEEPKCVRLTVFFWDDSQQNLEFCPRVVSKNNFQKFLARELRLDDVRALDDYGRYYTKDKEINAMLDEIQKLGGQLYIQRFSLAEWRLFVKNRQAEIILRTELESLNKETKTKTGRPCPPYFRGPYTIPL